MLRRRLSPLGRTALSAALEILPADASVPLVFASRHGDADRTLELLQSLALGDALSPTSFSLSVHNAAAGILSIGRGDIGAVTAIASVDNLLLSALIEAAAQLQEAPRVLCLVCDAPVPAFYAMPATGPDYPWALALLLERAGDVGDEFAYRLARQAVDPSTEAPASAVDLLPLLQGETDSRVLASGSPGWVLERCAEAIHAPA